MRAPYRENNRTAPAAQQLNTHTVPAAQQLNVHSIQPQQPSNKMDIQLQQPSNSMYIQPQQPSNSIHIQPQQPSNSMYIAYSPSSPATQYTYSPAAQQLNVHTAPAAQQLNVHSIQPQQPSNKMDTAPAAQQLNVHTAATVTDLPNQPPALDYHPTNFINVCNVGGLTIQCDKCDASKFKKETKAFYGGNGKYKLDILPTLPPVFNALYCGNPLHFNLCKYNCAFQITSFCCKEINLSRWNPNFRIQGQVCYHIGSLAPNDDQNAAFLQIYFLDESDQIGSRIAITDNLRPEILLDLQQSLHVHNIYVNCKRVKIRIRVCT